MSRRLLIFGASAHIGGPLAAYVRDHAPDHLLRLATSAPAKVEMLRQSFPNAEVVVANYCDAASLDEALAGVHGVFVVTPDFFDEISNTARLVGAVRRAGTVDHIVRIMADTPGMSLEKLPRELYAMGPGPAHQHFEAQAVLDASALPVTYLNSLGYYMDDFLIHFAPPLRASKTLVIPYERKMCFTDTTDLGEAAARLLVEGPDRHAGRYYHFNSGEDPIAFARVAELIGEAAGEPVAYDPDPERFLAELGPTLREITGDDRAARYFTVNWRMERDHQDAFFGSAFGAQILGRAPTSLAEWLNEHRTRLLAD